MEINLHNYKQFLYDTLLSDEDNLTSNRLSFAQSISASVPMYLGRQADLNNESEKEIYLYARQLMNEILKEKINYKQLALQIQCEIGVTEPVEKSELYIVQPTPLMEAIVYGNYREFKQLIATGADVNEPNGDGKFYPLNVALQSRRNSTVYVEALLNAGANIQQSDRASYELLVSAKDNLSVPVVELLKNAGVNINAEDKVIGSGTALIHLMQWGHFHSAKALIQAGADVNISNNYGHTPLYWAISYQNYPMMELLIDAGADVDKYIPGLNVTHRKLGFLRSKKENKESRQKWIALMKKVKQNKVVSEETNNKFISFFKNLFSGGRS